MPAPSTLLEHAEDEVSRYETLLAEARAELAAAQADARTHRAELRERAADLDRGRRKAAALREALSGIPTPADGDPLLEDLEDALMEARAANARVLELKLGLVDASVREELAAARIERTGQRLAEAREDVARATEDRHRWDEEWGPLLSSPPLSDLPDRASTLLDGSTYDALAQALNEAIPEDLRTTAERRLALERLRESNARALAAVARDLLDAHMEAFGDLRGLSAVARTAYEEAHRDLEVYVRRAADELRSAQELVDREAPEIPEGEAERLVELEPDGSAAAALEIAVTDARIEVLSRTLELETARLQAEADPDADPDVVTDAENALATAESDLAAAVAAFETDGHPETLERWQLALPEGVWRFYLRFLEVTRRLERFVADVDPADLESALDAAEQALAQSLAEEADARIRRDALRDGRREREARLRGLEEVVGDRALAAVRGDG